MITIRKARPGDAVAIAKMVQEGLKKSTWKYTGIDKYRKSKLTELRQSLSATSNTRTFLAVEDKHVVGSISYSFSKRGRLRHRVSLGWGIHPNYEGQGIGTKLLKHAVEDARKQGFKRAEAEMAIKNVGSWKIAQKCGFKIEGTKKKALITDNGSCIDTYIMGKILRTSKKKYG